MINLLVPGVSATPYEDNMRYFNVIICGPADSPYEGVYIFNWLDD